MTAIHRAARWHPAPGARVLIPYHRSEVMSLKEAAALAGRSETTLRQWCAEACIGRRVAGGNWQVSRVALAMLLDGDQKALDAYHRGDRTGPLVTSYFERAGLLADIASAKHKSA